MKPFDRRLFLHGAGAMLATSAIGPLRRSAKAADAAVIGKDPRLIVHVAEPPVLETPASLLAGEQVTPTSLFFVRNCQSTPHITGDDPLSAWQIELAGLVDGPQTFAAKLLRELPRTEVEMVVQCSGNGRTFFSQAAKTDGTQWLRGGMGNVRFAGVRLSTVLQRLKAAPQAAARFLTTEGRDAPPAGKMDFEHSMPLADAIARSLLAIELNGQPLPAVHGGPVRLVTPGFYGTMHVKWVGRIAFTEHESDHTSQIPDYRTPREVLEPGSKFKPTYDNSESNWRMRIKSVVLAPEADANLSAGEVTIRGVAFNDGEARIEEVLVSSDRGQSWQRAQLDVPQSPYAWYRWQARLALPPGRQEIWSQAVDRLGRTQPLDGGVFWNPKGYTWNGVEKIGVTVS